MSWQRWVLAVVVVLIASAQYGLLAYSLVDLHRRPRVRGENKMGWALLVAVLPIVGAVIYGIYGPSSFLPRPNRPPRRENVRLGADDLQDAP